MSFGFPCQPVSCAGKRKVTEDERWLFDVCADGIEILKPGILFAENVEGLLSAKMPTGKPVIAHIFERLERLHYTVEAGLFSAAEVGAPHQRKRVFILAYRDMPWVTPGGDNGRMGRKRESVKEKLANPRSPEPNRIPEPEERDCDRTVGESGEKLAYTSQQRSQGRSKLGKQETRREAKGKIRYDIAGHDPQRWPARPGQPQYEWEEPRTIDGKLNSSWVESLMDVPQSWTQIGKGDENRIDRLRLLGNGVVPATAEKAFRTLYGRIINPDKTYQQPSVQLELF